MEFFSSAHQLHDVVSSLDILVVRGLPLYSRIQVVVAVQVGLVRLEMVVAAVVEEEDNFLQLIGKIISTCY